MGEAWDAEALANYLQAALRTKRQLVRELRAEIADLERRGTVRASTYYRPERLKSGRMQYYLYLSIGSGEDRQRIYSGVKGSQRAQAALDKVARGELVEQKRQQVRELQYEMDWARRHVRQAIDSLGNRQPDGRSPRAW